MCRNRQGTLAHLTVTDYDRNHSAEEMSESDFVLLGLSALERPRGDTREGSKGQTVKAQVLEDRWKGKGGDGRDGVCGGW